MMLKTVIGTKLLIVALALCAPVESVAQSRWEPTPPLKNPALLNIGLICRWQSTCISKQSGAMRSSLRYVRSGKLPAWKVQLCNRNASRNGTRKDWVGFNRCIRNRSIRS
jgi:hypothetical protein